MENEKWVVNLNDGVGELFVSKSIDKRAVVELVKFLLSQNGTKKITIKLEES